MAELQKKVKVLQQRHRRHLEKLLGLENTVSQLRQSNLLNEERLQLLERVRSEPVFTPNESRFTPKLKRRRCSRVSFSCRCFLTFHRDAPLNVLFAFTLCCPLILRLTYRPAQRCRTPGGP